MEPTNRPAALALEQVSKTYGSARVLDRIDLTVARGETTVLIGPSGCGKSTLLRLMIGLVSPDGGVVRVDGEALTAANVRAVRQRMGYVIQEGGLFPHLTARRNVALMARFLGWERARVDARIRDLAELVQLPARLLDHHPAQLSGGQRQRVGLMRALVLDPAVLLLDEPLGALDPIIRADLQDDLRRIFRQLGKTVVLVTHDLAEAAFFGGTVVLLRAGRIVQQGALNDLVRRPADAFVEAFVRAQRPVGLP